MSAHIADILTFSPQGHPKAFLAATHLEALCAGLPMLSPLWKES